MFFFLYIEVEKFKNNQKNILLSQKHNPQNMKQQGTKKYFIQKLANNLLIYQHLLKQEILIWLNWSKLTKATNKTNKAKNKKKKKKN